jgi:A/G-specific adenine glycosylase
VAHGAGGSADARQHARLRRRRAALLAWYDGERRDLPWRRSRDPYAVLVSEVMLQQTRAETVVPYYERFLARFPSVEALAEAQPDEVVALWSGLGYYRRARSLLSAARKVVRAGGFPRTASGLERLPGIGPYTAAAVASIAFGEPVAVVDGNVERVTARLLALAGAPRRQPARRRLAAAAQVLLSRERPGDSNQALMELGATVCTPRQPRCPVCPLRSSCRAAAAGRPERFPRRPRRLPLEPAVVTAALVERDGSVLLVRRAESEGLLPGTWELPWAHGPRRGAAARLARRYGGTWRLAEEAARLRHTVTRRRLEVAVHRATFEAATVAEGVPARWVRRDEVEALPISGLLLKALAATRPA